MTASEQTAPAPYDLAVPPVEAFVFLHHGGAWRPISRLKLDDADYGRPASLFTYGQGWLNDAHAFPIDPLNLPLTPGTRHMPGIPGVFRDSCPDSWGSRLFDREFDARLTATGARRRLPNILDRLLLGGDDRSGALAFGIDPVAPFIAHNGVQAFDMDEMATAIDQIANGGAEPKVQRLIAPGTSLGGARPKCTVSLDDGSLWIAKFSRRDDAITVPIVEAATMALAATAGIRIHDAVSQTVAGHPIFLARRFDRGDDGETRYPFLSALSLLNERETSSRGSYPMIADAMRQAGMPDADLTELFRRMVFNIAIGNRDDHLRNHGFLCHDGAWRLAPAYDLVPTPDMERAQAIGVGSCGTTASIANAMTQHPRFGMNDAMARLICEQVLTAVSCWKALFREHGVSKRDLQTIERGVLPQFQERHRPGGAAPQP